MNGSRSSSTLRPVTRGASTGAVPLVAAVVLVMGMAGPAVGAGSSPAPTTAASPTVGSVTLMTHDSFLLSEDVLTRFEQEHGATLEVLAAGDAGVLVNTAVLAADHPLADVLYGIDTTFLSRGLDAGIFQPYHAEGVGALPAALLGDPEERVTPIDFGDVCLNLDREVFADGALPKPERLEDLTRPELRGTLVVENPATSSPGLAFLLATIVRFGEEGDYPWQRYWADLRANDVLVAADWDDAYYSRFSGGTGAGDRPIVVSYASSPAAEVFFADPQPAESPTEAVLDGCFRQVEYAAVLAGSDAGELAGELVDFLLSEAVQEDIPLNMFVYPALPSAQLPDVFQRFAQQAPAPLTMEAARIDAGRERWIEEWTDIVLR
jgi:thiamine transport system substrate-binding protein